MTTRYRHLRGCHLFAHPSQGGSSDPNDCQCAALRREPEAGTQNARILAYIRAHPDATVMECSRAMHPWVANIRARHSDLRNLGFDIQAVRRTDGREGFRLVEHGQATLGLTA